MIERYTVLSPASPDLRPWRRVFREWQLLRPHRMVRDLGGDPPAPSRAHIPWIRPSEQNWGRAEISVGWVPISPSSLVLPPCRP